MKKSELAKILKPLIKECVKEVIFEEGVLSGIVSEVVQGMGAIPLVERQKQPTPRIIEEQSKQDEMRLHERKNKMDVTRKKMLEAISQNAYNGVDLFEGTKPLRRGGNPSTEGKPPSDSLSGVDPSDAGVDISSLLGGMNYKGVF